MMAENLVAVDRRALTPAQFGDLADVPPELEWLANITNPKTRRAYKNDVSEFSAFTGLRQPAELPDHHACSCDRLAQAPRVSRTRPVQHPPQALGAVGAVRVSPCCRRLDHGLFTESCSTEIGDLPQ